MNCGLHDCVRLNISRGIKPILWLYLARMEHVPSAVYILYYDSTIRRWNTSHLRLNINIIPSFHPSLLLPIQHHMVLFSFANLTPDIGPIILKTIHILQARFSICSSIMYHNICLSRSFHVINRTTVTDIVHQPSTAVCRPRLHIVPPAMISVIIHRA